MSLLDSIQTGMTPQPPRIVIYGSEGCGKSTATARAPAPIFVPTEDGLNQIDCAKFPLATSLADVNARLDALLREEHTFSTVVIDSLDWLERLLRRL